MRKSIGCAACLPLVELITRKRMLLEPALKAQWVLQHGRRMTLLSASSAAWRSSSGRERLPASAMRRKPIRYGC